MWISYTRRRTDVLAWRGNISLNEEVVYITLFRSNVYGIIFSCQTLQVEKLKQHLMLICANKVLSCVTRFDDLFSVLELQCLIEFNTVVKSCHLINEMCSVAVYPMLYSGI